MEAQQEMVGSLSGGALLDVIKSWGQPSDKINNCFRGMLEVSLHLLYVYVHICEGVYA